MNVRSAPRLTLAITRLLRLSECRVEAINMVNARQSRLMDFVTFPVREPSDHQLEGFRDGKSNHESYDEHRGAIREVFLRVVSRGQVYTGRR